MITVLSAKKPFQRANGGFTLVELMIALSLGLLVLAALMSSVMFMMRSSLSLSNYIDMNAENRLALEIIGRDLRNGVDIASDFSATEFQVGVLQMDGSLKPVTYRYRVSGSERVLVRSTPGEEEILADGIEDLVFTYYNLVGSEVEEFPLAVTQVKVQMTTARPTQGLENTERINSARFILRNKYVTN